MSYDAIRNATRRILQEIEETKGYSGRVLVDEHPWGAEDMLAISAIRDGKVVGALILRADPDYHTLDIDRVDMSTFARHSILRASVTPEGTFDTGAVSRRLFAIIGGHLGPTAAEIAHQREAADLDARTRATRPRVIPEVIPAEGGAFNLVLRGLTANDVLRAVEALPEAKPPASSRTAYDHLLADEL